MGTYLQLFNLGLTSGQFTNSDGAVTLYQLPFDTTQVFFPTIAEYVLVNTFITGYSQKYVPYSVGGYRTFRMVVPGAQGFLLNFIPWQTLVRPGSIFEDENTVNIAVRIIQPITFNFVLMLSTFQTDAEMVYMSFLESLLPIGGPTSPTINQTRNVGSSINRPLDKGSATLIPVFGSFIHVVRGISEDSHPSSFGLTPLDETAFIYTMDINSNTEGTGLVRFMYYAQFCGSNCLACSDPTTCILPLSAGVVPLTCPTGQYHDATGNCVACPTGCVTCTSSICTAADGSISCRLQTYRTGTPIAGECPCLDGFYEDATRTCKPCPAGRFCETCFM